MEVPLYIVCIYILNFVKQSTCGIGLILQDGPNGGGGRVCVCRKKVHHPTETGTRRTRNKAHRETLLGEEGYN